MLEGSTGPQDRTGVQHCLQGPATRSSSRRAGRSDHDGRTLRFARDQVFSSPSAAAAVVVGRAANGRNDWKIRDTGVSYGNWQTRGIDPTAKETSP